MYEGTIAVKAAANKPAEDFFVTSVVNRNDDSAAFAENIGARKTQTFLILTEILRALRTQYKDAAVSINPGYIVPPIVLPSGYQPRSSNQFKNSKKPSDAKYFVVRKLKYGSNSCITDS